MWLDQQGHKQFRSVVARAIYLSLDRPDIQHPVQGLSSVVDKPQMKHWHDLKGLGRYLKGKMRMIQMFKWCDKHSTQLDVWSDADWASAAMNRKSVSGGIIMWNNCLIKSWSRTQSLIALSSALVKASTECMGMMAMLRVGDRCVRNN